MKHQSPIANRERAESTKQLRLVLVGCGLRLIFAGSSGESSQNLESVHHLGNEHLEIRKQAQD